MAWNQPKNNGQNRDPWQSNNTNQDSKSVGNKSGNQDIPPDLDDIFRKLINKFSSLFNSKKSVIGGGNGKKNDFGNGNKQSKLGGSYLYISGIIMVAALSVWIAKGFYTIKETERGVVTRFGKFSHLVRPGLNWKPNFIDEVHAVNVETVRELSASGTMLTSDENVVRVEMNVQYRVTNPERYLFAVKNADDSLRQATDSALRGVIGRSTMDRILTEGRTIIRSETQRELDETIHPYDMGISLLDVNFQTSRPPEEVKASFDDAIAARENREQSVREAEAYANGEIPVARGKAQETMEKARAYKARILLEAQGEIDSFNRILKEYKNAPHITRERLYIETMERLLGHTRKVLLNNDKANNINILPLEQLLSSSKVSANIKLNRNNLNNNLTQQFTPVVTNRHRLNEDINNQPSLLNSDNVMDQRRSSSKR